jgi:hypothetical protein
MSYEVTIGEFEQIFQELLDNRPLQVETITLVGTWEQSNSTVLGAKIMRFPAHISVGYRIEGTGETGVYVR